MSPDLVLFWGWLLPALLLSIGAFVLAGQGQR